MQHLLNRCAVLLKNIPNKVNQRCAAAKFQKNPPKESAWHVQLSHLKVKDEMRDHRRIAFMLIIPSTRNVSVPFFATKKTIRN